MTFITTSRIHPRVTTRITQPLCISIKPAQHARRYALPTSRPPRPTHARAAHATSSLPSTPGPDYTKLQRNLALELVRVTEAAALAAGRWFGKGDKEAADDAAVQAMRKVLNCCAMDGVVIIGGM